MSEEGEEYEIADVEWAAPELLRGKQPTMESDIYSFGVILYEILSGQKPHNGYSNA